MATLTTNTSVREVLSQIIHDPNYKEVNTLAKLDLVQTLVAFAAVGTFAVSSYWYLIGIIPWWLAVGFNIVAVYLAFTTMHDAAHRAVSSHNLFNDVLGTLAGQILLPAVNMPAWRAIHMDHHRYIGEDGKDPDLGLVEVPKWAGISYLMFTDIHYLAFFFKNGKDNWSPRIRRYVYLMIASTAILHVAFLASPYWLEFLILYVIPNRLGLGLVVYTFAYVQHPHGTTWESDPWKSTVQIHETSPLRSLMFGQENHHIHHLMPHIPWYKYPRVMELGNGIVKKQDIPRRGWLYDNPHKMDVPDLDPLLPIEVRVARITDVGEDIRAFEFEPTSDGVVLPEGPAGSHISVFINEGLIRQYSMVAHDEVRNRYRIAVKRDDQGRGGSKAMHELTEGQVLKIGHPRNNFMLYENAKRSILISGGIGITPMLAMAHRLLRVDRPFQFHVCARNEAAVAFKEELAVSRLAKHVQIHLNQEDGKSGFTPEEVLARPDKDTLIYICGPAGFMNWVREAAIARGWPEENIRIESFSAPIVDNAANRAFTLHLSRSGKDLSVGPDQSIRDALHHAGMDPKYACMQGTCGTCITPVLEGEVDHRDAYLSESEKKANCSMCVCVSRASGERISIDM